MIVGVGGDLATKSLLPALSEIRKAGQLPADFQIIGLSRRKLYKAEILKGKKRNIASIFKLLQLNIQDPTDLKKLKVFLKGKKAIFYLSIPPITVNKTLEQLGKAGLNSSNIKLLMEKPFGVDLKSAEQLVAHTNKFFSEDQIYRVDHFLAKEVAQNIAVVIGRNALLRNVWNSQFIERIEIIAAEKIGIEGRRDFYEQTGALRDLLQSHLLQLAALTLMEPCDDIDNVDEIVRRRQKALLEIMPIKGKLLKEVKRAQYEGYKDESGNQQSQTETYARVKLFSRNKRWKNVPITLATGKALNDKLSEIRIFFKATDINQTNRLRLRIQPEEGLELDLWVKEPGYERELQSHSLGFLFNQHFKRLPDAYERVLVDVINDEHGLFASNQEIIAGWKIFQPVLDYWAIDKAPIKKYKKGLTLEEVLNSI